jgi:hypothetical protein
MALGAMERSENQVIRDDIGRLSIHRSAQQVFGGEGSARSPHEITEPVREPVALELANAVLDRNPVANLQGQLVHRPNAAFTSFYWESEEAEEVLDLLTEVVAKLITANNAKIARDWSEKGMGDLRMPPI